MTEEQRRQAAAQRCADLANKTGDGWTPEHLLSEFHSYVALNAILQLDELACHATEDAQNYGLEDLGRMARKHILATPGPSPVERLAEAYGRKAAGLQITLDALGLQLVEKSDD